jgi:hypothetical protein
MALADDPFLSFLLLTLCAVLLFLRFRFRNASRRSETLVLVSAAALFFSICNHFLSGRTASSGFLKEAIQIPLTR